MLTYELEADRDVIVQGLASLHAGEPRMFTEEEIAMFEHIRGLKLNQECVPEGVTITVHSKEGE